MLRHVSYIEKSLVLDTMSEQGVVIHLDNNWSCSWFKNSMAVTLAQGEGLQILGRLDIQADSASAANAGAVAASCRLLILQHYLFARLHQQMEDVQYSPAMLRCGLGKCIAEQNKRLLLVPGLGTPPALRETEIQPWTKLATARMKVKLKLQMVKI